MNKGSRKQIMSIIDRVSDMTIATVRPDGYPQATTVSYVNDGLTIYFGTSKDSQKAANIAKSDKVSLVIDRDYNSWNDIEGLSISGRAALVTDPEEQQKVSSLLFKTFPQISAFIPADVDPEELALFRIDPKFVSLLDYSKGFGHTELFEI